MKTTVVPQTLPRREFLRISSTAVIAVAASGLIKPKALYAATIADPSFQPLLSIGYAPSVPWSGNYVSLRPADDNLIPDPRFISRGARVAVVGSERSPKQRNEPGALYLDAIFPSVSGAASEDSRFGFWSVAGHPVRDSVSSKFSFHVPVLATTGLSFLAQYRQPALVADAARVDQPPVERANVPFTLSLGGVPGPKLQAGVYVIALREATEGTTTPNWDRLRLSSNDGKVVVPGADFTYVIVTVDYSDGTPATGGGRRRIA